MISVKGLTKDFDGFRALDGVDMDVPDGSIYGLVGTNGAGKTTILKLLAGVLAPDGGDAEIGGLPVFGSAATRGMLAFIPDDLDYYRSYNLNEMERLLGGLYRRWDPEVYDVIVSGFGLDRRNKLSKFSKGMRKQAVFAAALATTPDCLLLDEPIDGLDPIARKKIWAYIVSASADRGMTTLVSSHNLREMEGFCDRIGVIDHGVMKLERELDDLTSDLNKVQASFGPNIGDSMGMYDDLNVRAEVRHFSSVGSVDYLIVKGGRDELMRWRDEKRPLIFDITPMTIEEVFIYELGGESDAVKSIIG
ncbi:MAG: ABC transporter ATP-binding protein [Clostridiales Family XIII bacterium]|jgi:ABC-2 type transport system ATP-binding protein|nr:ABC transporter ATP-binding protein [Clostridiales Family XIII bacterium]